MDETTLRADGWSPIEVEGFCSTISPLWVKGEPGARTVGLLVRPEHANVHLRTLYGGALMTFADAALSLGVGEVLEGMFAVTAQLQTYFVAAARIGDLVECKPEIMRRTKDMVFVRALLTVNERTVAGADGIWKVIDPART